MAEKSVVVLAVVAMVVVAVAAVILVVGAMLASGLFAASPYLRRKSW